MGWSYPQKSTDYHHTPGPDLESPGKEKEGTTEEQLEEDSRAMGYNWSQIESLAQDRDRWRAAVDGLCPQWANRHK